MCIYLVDVEGHGVPAALQCTVVAPILQRALVKSSIKGADQLLEEADRMIQNELGHANVAVTMNLLQIDPSRRKVSLANAGMPSPLLFRYGQAQPEPMQAAGVYVGGGYSRYVVMPRRADREVNVGDLIVLFSDGVVESRNSEGKIFGSQGVAAAVAKTRAQSPPEIVNAILRAAEQHAGSESPQDDQAVIVVLIGQSTPSVAAAGAETFKWVIVDQDSAECTLINASNTPTAVEHDLRRATMYWLEQHGVEQQGRRRLWNAIRETVANAVMHGSLRGELIAVKLRKTATGQISVEVEQPREWRDWYQYLGEQRRETLGEPMTTVEDLQLGGTISMLRRADSVIVSRQGRSITLLFSPGTHGAQNK